MQKNRDDKLYEFNGRTVNRHAMSKADGNGNDENGAQGGFPLRGAGAASNDSFGVNVALSESAAAVAQCDGWPESKSDESEAALMEKSGGVSRPDSYRATVDGGALVNRVDDDADSKSSLDRDLDAKFGGGTRTNLPRGCLGQRGRLIGS